MQHKIITLAALLFSLVLTGCQSTQTAYGVTSLEQYKKGRSTGFYGYGVTEEKVNDRIYHIMVKLDGSSHADRAKDMFFLHAANLTLKHNFEKFTTEKRRGGRWCYGKKHIQTKQRSTEEAGPKYSGFVLLIKDKKKLYIAEKVKKDKEAKVEAIIDDETMSANKTRYINACDGY